MREVVLVVAAHADDEVLGCGGTMARHAAHGDSVHTILLADGVTSRDTNADSTNRNVASVNAAKVLHSEPPYLFNMPDNRLDTVALLDIVKVIEDIIDELLPTIIYTHHGGDLNIDHALTHQAVMTACRPIPGTSVNKIYGFEVVSSTEWASPDQNFPFRPVHFIEITDYLTSKIEALACYAEEMRPFPHARSREAIEALACLRGSQVGVTAAEAFTVLRQIKPI